MMIRISMGSASGNGQQGSRRGVQRLDGVSARGRCRA
jgi:hypothetical protein